jgi:hypothetical protein
VHLDCCDVFHSELEFRPMSNQTWKHYEERYELAELSWHASIRPSYGLSDTAGVAPERSSKVYEAAIFAMNMSDSSFVFQVSMALLSRKQPPLCWVSTSNRSHLIMLASGGICI